MTQERWEKLDVWRQADEMAYQVYLITRKFPKEEIYGITSQLRRAALSIPTNIVEGYSRKGDRELGRFLNVSLGSLAEVKYLIYFAHRLNYLSKEEYAVQRLVMTNWGRAFGSSTKRLPQALYSFQAS